MKDIFLDQFEKQSTKWSRTIKKYLQELNVNLNGLINLKDLNKYIKEIDSKMWNEEIQKKITLENYHMWKSNIKEEEKLYGNGLDSAILFRARTNTLDLQWRKKFLGESTICNLCRKKEETLEHFLLECEELQPKRNECLLLMNPQPQNKDNLIKKLLLFEWENVEEIFKYRKVLYRLWKTREMKLKRNQ